MKIIIILGLPLSGKTTHAKVLEKDMNIPLVETGTFVLKAVKDRGFEAVPENIIKVAGELKSKNDAVFTEMALNYTKENYPDAKVVFFSGIKAESEVEFLKKVAGEDNVYLVSFHASPNTRHQRLFNEDRKVESKGNKAEEDVAMANDRARFNLRDEKELGYGLGNLIAKADFVVNTEDKIWPYHNFEITINDFKTIINKLLEN